MGTKKSVGKLLKDSAYKKRYPTSGTADMICLSEEKTLILPSRILTLNDQLGGGLRYGHIIELYGEENVGKTLLAIDFGTVTQALGGIVAWADAESTFNGPWAIKNGLDLSKVYLLPQENRVELIADWMIDTILKLRAKLTNNEPILLVLDSIAALECADNLEIAQVDAKAEMGNRAKALEALLRRRNTYFHKYGVCCIFINQLRAKIGATRFEDPDQTPVGKAMKFYASQRLGIYRGKLLKNTKDQKVGRLVYSRLHKTKLAMPKENISAEVYFKEHEGKLGYSKYFGFVELLVEKKVLTKRKGNYYYKDKLIAKSEKAMNDLLVTDDKLRKKLIRKSGVFTISQARERIASQTRNNYPVKVAKDSDDDE